MAGINPPPLKIPKAIRSDPEHFAFINQLLVTLRQLSVVAAPLPSLTPHRSVYTNGTGQLAALPPGAAGNTLVSGGEGVAPHWDQLAANMVAFTLDAEGSIETTVEARLSESAYISDFGAVLDGVTDDTAAINLALAAGYPRVILDQSSAGAYINGSLTIPAGVELVGIGRPAELVCGPSALVLLEGDEAGFRNVHLTGAHSSSTYTVQISASAARCVVDVSIDNGNSGVLCNGPDATITLVAREFRGTGVRLNGTDCTQAVVKFLGRNLGGFGVYVTLGARAKSIHAAKYSDPAYFTAWQLANRSETADDQCGLETVGVTYDSPEQTIEYCYAHGSGDAGCSLTSSRNHLGMMTAVDCALNGLSLIGSDNVVGTLNALRCQNGLGCTPNAGGLSRNNSVGVVNAHDNTEYGVAFNNSNYREWVSAGTYGSAVSYCVYGLNIYKAGTSTDTFGTVAPVHTSGTVSDGVNDWTYIDSTVDNFDADGLVIGYLNASGNVLGDTDAQSSGSARVLGARSGIAGIPTIGGYIPSTTSGTGPGDARGDRAVDWQQDRGLISQIASGQEAVVSGGSHNTASGLRATVGGGRSNVASGTATTVAGGEGCGADGSYSWVPGGRYGQTAERLGVGVWSAHRHASTSGSGQAVEGVLLANTTDATPTRLTANLSAAASTNVVNLKTNGVQAAILLVSAVQTGGAAGAATDCAQWVVNVLLSRASTNASTRLAGGGTAIAPTNSIGGGSAWLLDVTVDTTVASVIVTGTGEASKTIEWTCRFIGVEKAA